MDTEGFSEWADGCQQRLLRSAYLLTGDLGRAEDLVQEALVKVALRWGRLRDGQPTAYARTVIARDNISWWRKHKREVVGVEPADRPGPATESDLRLVVLEALENLTPAQRRVVVLRHFDDLTEIETARVLGVSVGTVKSQNAAALARLRERAPELGELTGRNHD